jgi:hypothetical protein
MDITTIITYVLTGMGLLSAFLTLILLLYGIRALNWFIKKTKIQINKYKKKLNS